MRFLLFCFLSTIAIHTSAQVTEQQRQCTKQENLASKDNYNSELKYYSFGLRQYDSLLTIKAYVLKHYYNIKLIELGCVVPTGLTCYNQMSERIAMRKFGKDFWEQVAYKTDSIAKSSFKSPH